MNSHFLKEVLNHLKEGKLDVDEAFEKIKDLPYFAIGNIKFDFHRSIRRSVPEVVYGEGKNIDDLRLIIKAVQKNRENLIITRLNNKVAAKLQKEFDNTVYDSDSRVFFLKNHALKKAGKGKILVLSAGTSDYPVAKEAELCACYLGNEVELVCDIGVAGFHRINDFKEKIKNARILIVVAGMEGALPSFIAGMTDKPVVAVPTSVGYGANLGGFTSLFGMLCNCSGGVAVVNIDNGFGAAYFASLVNRL